MARSSTLAIMDTWACYMGKLLTWDQAMSGPHVVAPQQLALDADPPTLPDAQGNYAMPSNSRRKNLSALWTVGWACDFAC